MNINENAQTKSNNNCDRRSDCKRWLILFLCCFSTFGNYYCIDNVGVLHDSLKFQFIHLGSDFEFYFGLLYSLYSVPNIILPFIGGFFIMKLGIRLMYIIFGLLIMIGQLMFALGCQNNSIVWMLVGRAVFGLGGESINITQNSMIMKWFFKSDIALPLGLSLSISRLGSVLNDIASPIVAHHWGNSKALWVGFGFCLFSLFTCLILSYFDKKQDEYENYLEIPDDSELFDFQTFKIFKNLDSMFWLMCCICMTLYGFYLPFNYIASGFLTSTYFSNITNKQTAQEKAGIYASIPFFLSGILVPFFGLIVDKYGQRSYFALLSSFLGLISFISFYLTPPIISFILLGFTYTVFATIIWPTIALVINKSESGFAFGITISIQNLGLSIFPMIVATIYSNTKDYYTTMIFFIIMSIISIILCGVLIWLNIKKGDIINKTEFNEYQEMDYNCNDENEKLKLNEVNFSNSAINEKNSSL